MIILLSEMVHVLDNPVFNALVSRDAHLGTGNERVRLFDPAVSPFVGIKHHHAEGLKEISGMVERGRKILVAIPSELIIPQEWKLMNFIEGLQFILEYPEIKDQPGFSPERLNADHVKEMINLTRLTKPGPFDDRTIDFGNYYGIFEDGQLTSMAGQRLHVDQYSEISAVCTHPDHLGNGHAGKLLQFQVNLIAIENKIPFMHVRSGNDRAIKLYERMGFKVRIPMNFYFLRKV